MRALRAHASYRNAALFLVPEANLGNEAQYVTDDLIGMAGVEVVCQFDHAYGVFTTPTLPQAYAYRLQRKLDESAVAFRADLVAANPRQMNMTPARRAAAARDVFLRQLKLFQRTPIVPKSLLAKIRYAYSGKADKDGERTSSKKHDAIMAFMIGLYWSGEHMIGETFTRGAQRRLVVPDASAPPRSTDSAQVHPELTGGAR